MFKKELLIKVMEEKNFTAYKLWKTSKVAQSTISTILNGNNLNPSTKTLEKLASALEVPMSSFFDEDIEHLDIQQMNIHNTITEKSLTENEILLLSKFNKLNDIGKKEAIKRVEELTEINKYIKENNVANSITSTKAKTHSLEDTYTTIAAHDDDLTADEKQEINNKILEILNKKHK